MFLECLLGQGVELAGGGIPLEVFIPTALVYLRQPQRQLTELVRRKSEDCCLDLVEFRHLNRSVTTRPDLCPQDHYTWVGKGVGVRKRVRFIEFLLPFRLACPSRPRQP